MCCKQHDDLITKSNVFERTSLIELVHILRNRISLALQIIFHRTRKLGMRQPVRGAGGHRQESTRQFVLALGAALECLYVARDTKLDRLVVASLEMQTGVKFERTP